MISSTTRLFAATVALTAAAVPAVAQDAGGQRWQVEFTPYIWAAGMSGTVRIDDRPQAGLAVEQSFSDIAKILEFALMGELEASKGRWGVFADGVYFKVNDEGSVSGPAGFTSLSADATITQQMYSFAGSYRFVEGRSPVDLYGGLRYNSIKWDIDVAVSAPVVAGRRIVQTKDWVDPYVGIRIKHPLDERWTLMGYADVGGFGVGSDLAVQAVLGAQYAFRPDLIGKVGYRYVAVDYDKDGFQYDMANGGLVFGLGWRW
jgi:hypothetical protein